jgi:hypothetical protein
VDSLCKRGVLEEVGDGAKVVGVQGRELWEGV